MERREIKYSRKKRRTVLYIYVAQLAKIYDRNFISGSCMSVSHEVSGYRLLGMNEMPVVQSIIERRGAQSPKPVVDPEFPRAKGANPAGGRQHTIWPNFPKDCMKLKVFGPRGDRGMPLPKTAPSLSCSPSVQGTGNLASRHLSFQ